MSGSFIIPNVVDTPFNNAPLVMSIATTPSALVYDIEMDLSSISSALNLIRFQGELNGTVLNVTNQQSSINGVIDILVNGSINFNSSFTEIISSQLIFTEQNGSTVPVSGDITFTAIKQ